MSELALGEALEVLIDHRGKTPRKLGGDFTHSGVPVGSAMLVRDGRLALHDARYVSEEMYERWMPIKTRRHDVILTSEAPVGRVALVPDDRPLVLGQRLFGLRGREGVLENRYLYYVLQSNRVQAELLSRATGTTVSGIRQSELVRVQIPVPNINEQRKISRLLGALDDKIALNDQIASAACELASAMFMNMFEEADEPKHRLGDMADVVDCLHSRKPELAPDSLNRYLVLADIREDGRLENIPQFCISEEDYHLWTRRIEVREGDCVITNVGRVGAVAQIPKGVVAAVGRNMTAVRPRRGYPASYIFEALRSPSAKSEIAAKTDEGTVLSALNVRSIPDLLLPVGNSDVREEFHQRASKLHELQDQMLCQNSRLVELRDALLPGLMSGEIRVRDAEKVVEGMT